MNTTYIVLVVIVFALVGLCVIGNLIIRPRMLRWGSTIFESQQMMEGDGLISDPAFTTTRAIQIEADKEKVWPWIAQMGQGRGGFYSYTWLENLVGLNIHNVDKVIPELQEIKIGDTIPFWQGAGVEIVKVESKKLLVLAGSLFGQSEGSSEEEPGGTWVFKLEEIETSVTRLIVRSRVAKFEPEIISIILYRLLLEPIHFIMERGMLNGIKRRAESK
jgi:hypothetical protein